MRRHLRDLTIAVLGGVVAHWVIAGLLALLALLGVSATVIV